MQIHQSPLLRNKKEKRAAIELLIESARRGKIETVSRLLAEGLPIESQAKDGQTALHAASESGQTKVVKLLLKKSANIEVRIPCPLGFYSHPNTTPLMLASLKGHEQVVEQLLAAGADPKATYDDDGERNALVCAIHGGHLSIVKKFMKLGIKVPSFALHRPVACGYIELLKHLIKAGAGLNFRTEVNGVPLLVAAAMHSGNDSIQVIKILLKAGVDINSKQFDQTALMRAIHVDATEAALYLVKRGADIHHCDQRGRNALMYAVDARNLRVAEALLKAGGKMDLTDVRGDTVLTLAKRNKDKAMLELLARFSNTPSRQPSGRK